MLAGVAPLAHRLVGRLGAARGNAAPRPANTLVGPPGGAAMLAGVAPLAHRQMGRLGAARRSALNTCCSGGAPGRSLRRQRMGRSQSCASRRRAALSMAWGLPSGSCRRWACASCGKWLSSERS